MKFLSIFLLGIVIGYFIKDYTSDSDKNHKPQNIVVIKTSAEPKAMKMLSVSKGSEMAVKNQFPRHLQIKEKRKLSISIGEELISQMETDWSALREQAETYPDNEGWKITILKTNSLFSQAGLQSGDYINKDSLRAAFNNPNNDPGLLNRFEYILNYISQ